MQSSVSGHVIWFTGLSGAGKSTICIGVAHHLRSIGLPVEILDGDTVRQSLCRDLSFTDNDRLENVRRLTFVADLLAKHGVMVLVAAISPLTVMRDIPRQLCANFIEVFVDASLEVCERRDPKGLYRRARAGEIRDFTGIDSPYERPLSPDIVCCTGIETALQSTRRVLEFLNARSLRSSLVAGSIYGGKEAQPPRRATLAVDFDGVIADYDGWAGIGVLGAAREDVRDALQKLKAEGWKVVVFSTRSVSELLPHLINNGIPFDEINSNSDYLTGGSKPVATVYWDDRGLKYSGDASLDLQQIRTFRTWSGRR